MRPLTAALLLFAGFWFAGCSSPPTYKPAPQPAPRVTDSPRPVTEGPAVELYAFNVGGADFKDMALMSDTGEYDGHPGGVCDTCFLVKHPKGTLMWDTGLPDSMADKPEGVDNNGIHMKVEKRLVDQLASIHVAPKDVTYVAFSHFHFDHTGNANLFAGSEWILNKAEVAWGLGPNAPASVNAASWSAYATAKTKMIDGDLDVFGDGSVRILRTPGHTPGHQVLLLKLREAGVVMLSGDLYHLRENRTFQRVPDFNNNRAETLASFNRVETILKNTGGRLIIQHDPEDLKLLPPLPGCLK